MDKTYKIHAWILADTKENECHKYFSCKTKIGFYIKLFYCKLVYDYIDTIV